jgi:hypothetical protein
VNATKRLALASGQIVFHKPFSGVHVANALAYGQTHETHGGDGLMNGVTAFAQEQSRRER